MNYSDASRHGSAYGHRHHHRSSQMIHLRPKHPFARWLLNVCLLVGGCALLGAAIHYYNLGQDNEAKDTPASSEWARTDYTKAIFYSIFGAFSLTLGVRGEVKRMRSRSRKVRTGRHGKFPH